MDEAYTASLELDTSAFDAAVKSAMAVWENLQGTLKEGDPGTFNRINNQIKGVEDDFQKVKIIFEELTEQSAQGFGFGGRADVFNAAADAMEQMAFYIKEAENASKDLTPPIEEAAEASKDLKEETKETNVHIAKMPGWFKKMGMAIIGVRSVYAGFRRVVSTALQDNVKLSNQFTAIWHVLGAAITPILQTIANWITKIIGYINVFIKAVTGVDLVAKALKAVDKNGKSAAKTLAGFDELNNLDNNNSGAASWGDALRNIDLDTGWVDKIQAFGAWVKSNWPVVVATLAGILGALNASKIMSAVNALKQMGGSISSIISKLNIVQSLGVGIAIAGIVITIGKIIEFIKDPSWETFSGILKGISLTLVGLALATGNWSYAIAGVIAFVVSLVTGIEGFGEKAKAVWESVKEGAKNLWEAIKTFFSNLPQWLKDKWESIKTGIGEKWESIKQGAKDLWQSIKNVFANVGTWFSDKWKSVKDGFKSFCNGIISFIEGTVNKGITGINKIISAINRISFDVPDWVPIIGGKKFGFNLGSIAQITLPRLDSGTNYVPNDQLAMIHKGEAVIPKKFNSEQYFNNDETNNLLQALIDKVDSLELSPYITVRDVGEASVKYQNQQNRLRGRALVNG